MAKCYSKIVALSRDRLLLEVVDVGAGQRLQLLVPLPDGLAAHAAVELQLLHALQELHHLLPQLLLLLAAPVDPLAQRMGLQHNQLQQQQQQKKWKG